MISSFNKNVCKHFLCMLFGRLKSGTFTIGVKQI